MTLEIRFVAAADKVGWLALWNDYLAFYKVDLAPEVTASTWSRLLDPQSPVNCRLAVQDGHIAGFAIHHSHPSTWTLNQDCYLEDLYVDAAQRGQGIGRALIEDLLALGGQNGWSRLYWHTDEGNVTARKLYDTFVKSDGHVRYRIAIPQAKA